MNAQPLTYGRPLTSIQAGGFVVVESNYAPSQTLPRHGHDEAALCFAVRGSFAEEVGGRTFACAPYDIMIRPLEIHHSNRYGRAGARCVLVGVTAECLSRLEPHTALFETPRRLPREVGHPLGQRLHHELLAGDDASALTVEGLVLELIGASSRRERAAGAPPWLAVARDYVHAHWQKRPGLAEIAGACGVHPASVVRAFRRHLRCSPGEYVRVLRLEHARKALARSSRPIAEIAVEAGFYDQAHFTTAFRRHFGMTPAKMRSI
jgi:AraC family transcriptional regulator